MEIITPANEYWIHTTVDKTIMDYVWSQIKLAKNDAKSKLVGHVSSSLDLPDEKNILVPYIEDAAKRLTYLYEPQLKVQDMWVNFQKKYEFNPLHAHPGVISFVLWMRIPYKYEDECKTFHAQNVNDKARNGCFSFVYTSMLGLVNHYDYLLDTAWEGTLLVFPSQLKHQVYPFYTSDEERISIAGNIY